jgi:hypothetical protein
MIQAQVKDAFGGVSILDQRLGHLLEHSCFAHPPRAGQKNGPAQVAVFQIAPAGVKGQPPERGNFMASLTPPGIEPGQHIDNLAAIQKILQMTPQQVLFIIFAYHTIYF